VGLINIEETRLEVFRELLFVSVRLNFLHAFNLLLLGATLDLSTLPSLSELFDLSVLKFALRLLTILIF
jgi:hypothetical protein